MLYIYTKIHKNSRTTIQQLRFNINLGTVIAKKNSGAVLKSAVLGFWVFGFFLKIRCKLGVSKLG